MVFLGSTRAISHSNSSTRALQAGAREENRGGDEENGLDPGTSIHPCLDTSQGSASSRFSLSLCLYLHSVDPGSFEPKQFPAGPPKVGPANPSLSSLA